MSLNATPTISPKIGILRLIQRTAIRNTLKKMIASTDKQALGELLDLLELPAEIERSVYLEIWQSVDTSQRLNAGMKRLGYLSAFN